MEQDRIRDHLANERTYLAWVRTAVGIIVFGFAIGRFGLALRQFASLEHEPVQGTGMSLWFGNASIILGVGIMVAAFFRFRTTQRQIEGGTFHQSDALLLFVGMAIVVFGIALIGYLLLTQRNLG